MNMTEHDMRYTLIEKAVSCAWFSEHVNAAIVNLRPRMGGGCHPQVVLLRCKYATFLKLDVCFFCHSCIFNLLLSSLKVSSVYDLCFVRYDLVLEVM